MLDKLGPHRISTRTGGELALFQGNTRCVIRENTQVWLTGRTWTGSSPEQGCWLDLYLLLGKSLPLSSALLICYNTEHLLRVSEKGDYLYNHITCGQHQSWRKPPLCPKSRGTTTRIQIKARFNQKGQYKGSRDLFSNEHSSQDSLSGANIWHRIKIFIRLLTYVCCSPITYFFNIYHDLIEKSLKNLQPSQAKLNKSWKPAFKAEKLS